MKTPLDLMKDMINKEIVVPGLTADPQKTVVTLKEDNPNSTTGKISLHLPPDSIVFRLDMPDAKFKLKSSFLSESTGNLHGGCDYVVFCHYDEKYCAQVGK